MLARAIGFGLLLLGGLVPLGGAALLIQSQGVGALLSLGPAGWADLTLALGLPTALLLVFAAWTTQRSELSAFRAALLEQQGRADSRGLALEALLAESRDHTAVLHEQVRLLMANVTAGRRQAEVTQGLVVETRLQRLIAEWELVGRELTSILAAMWRLVHGWRSAEPPGAPLPLPGPEELPVAILKLLPSRPEEVAQLEVDERFVRQAARYRAAFQGFLDRVPETGPVNRALFRGMMQGQIDARLALLPRPDHGRVPEPGAVAAE